MLENGNEISIQLKCPWILSQFPAVYSKWELSCMSLIQYFAPNFLNMSFIIFCVPVAYHRISHPRESESQLIIILDLGRFSINIYSVNELTLTRKS